RGDPTTPGRLVEPGVPAMLTSAGSSFRVEPPWPNSKKTGRRLAFAKWLIQPDHPLTSRVMVNRVWKHHFGKGIVRSLGNFGKTGTPPTHPELLDWMSREFVARRFSMKSIHRLLVTSATYRQSSEVTPVHQSKDSDNEFFSRMPLTRLGAEPLYDAMLYVSGQLNETPSGPSDSVQARPDGLVTPESGPNGYRRMIYVRQFRKQVVTHLESFDFPQMNPNCVERRDSTVAPQALYLMNNGHVFQQAIRFAEQILDDVGDNPVRQVVRAFERALGRLPTNEEKELALRSLEQLTMDWRIESSKEGTVDESKARLNGLAAVCHAIFNSASFLYVD
ncbi:MAG: DUF1553 domain-containing protein, partial [Planctomycetes bacterium]|nr:DUF1553 domain-containing protein [Planctomycetota bacterium]